MVERNAPSPLRLRTVFISDIHLGFKGCSSELLLDFLHRVEMDTLFLVGDIIDVWSMQKSMFWPQSHNNVLRTILGKAKRGTKVIFIPGNHDEVFRDFDGAVFGNLEIHREYIHEGADGRRMLVMHGDEFDSVVKCSPLARQAGVHSLRHTVGRESLHQLGPSQARPAALVLVDVSQTQGENGRAIHRQFRRIGRQGGSQARRRNRSLRPHSSGRNA